MSVSPNLLRHEAQRWGVVSSIDFTIASLFGINEDSAD